MKTSKVVVLSLAMTAFGFGCGHQLQDAKASSTLEPPVRAAPLAAVPAPFTTPPVLTGTPDIAALAAKVKPVVVNITTTHDVKMSGGPGSHFHVIPNGNQGGDEDDDDSDAAPFPFPFRFPGGQLGPGGQEQTLRQRALGTGFLIDAQGHVVTNAHVIDGADTVKVKLSDDREFDAKVKGKDLKLDLAVLEIQGGKDLPALPAASLGSSEQLRVGEYVVAVGNPFGLGHTVTMGIVSAKSRTIGASQYDDFIQTDASINPGNSGGPLFDLRGQVVGINTAINPNGKGIGFAIPVDELKEILPQLLDKGVVSRGSLGLRYQPIDASLAKAVGLDHPRGAMVADLVSPGAAEKAGLKSGDVVLSVDGAEVAHANDLPKMIARKAPGTKVSLKVLRDKTERNFDVVLGSLDDPHAEKPRAVPASTPAREQKFGIELGDGKGGVRVERVHPAGANEPQLQPGDVILEVNRQQVNSAQLAMKAIESASNPVLIKVKRGNGIAYVALDKNN